MGAMIKFCVRIKLGKNMSQKSAYLLLFSLDIPGCYEPLYSAGGTDAQRRQSPPLGGARIVVQLTCFRDPYIPTPPTLARLQREPCPEKSQGQAGRGARMSRWPRPRAGGHHDLWCCLSQDFISLLSQSSSNQATNEKHAQVVFSASVPSTLFCLKSQPTRHRIV